MHNCFSNVTTIVLIFAITACSMGAPTPTATPLPTSTPVPPTATVTPSPTLTPTPVPMASVNEAVDCYAGPSEQYDKVASLETGAEIQVVGQSDDDTYWIVALEDGSECWLTKENATMIIGDTAALAQVAPPATPTLGPPAAPSEFLVQITCVITIYQHQKFLGPGFIITWQDNANNEEGYIVYKDGSEVKRVAANTTQYADDVYLRYAQSTYSGPPVIYCVASFNSAGISEIVEITVQINCPQ